MLYRSETLNSDAEKCPKVGKKYFSGTVEQGSPVQYSPRRQSRWVLADYGGKDLWKR